MGVTRRNVVARAGREAVFFRDSTRREAERRGVAGWVSNRLDGAVEAVFEGPSDAVEAMLDFVRHGPGHASVSGVEVRPEEPEGLRGFSVR